MKQMKTTVWVATVMSLFGSFTCAEVRYAETVHNGQSTYFVFEAPQKSEALEFLRARPVRDPLTYVVVETPQGNFARDCKAIFDESDGRTIESGLRPPLSVPKKSETHCYTCGCWVFPMVSPQMEGFARVIQLFTISDLKENSGGFTCPSCKLLMCAHCMDKPEAFDSEGKMTAMCPSCSKPMNHYECPEDSAAFMLRYVSTHRSEINERVKTTFGVKKPVKINF